MVTSTASAVKANRLLRRLIAVLQTFDQIGREPDLSHSFLYRRDLVGDPKVANRFLLQIEDGIGSSRVAVPWLPNAAGVNDDTAGRLNWVA